MIFYPRHIVFIILLIVDLTYMTPRLYSQSSYISESQYTLKTYPFSDPDPNPILLSNPLIYPYFKYDGYSQEGRLQDWKVVTLENEFIQVFILPQIGGKIWGAINKKNGREFIYRNEVIKFRNISMRGPWTSGGIEFNFGIIGHHPSTATPVDYILEEHEDGSVSCTVGNIDLPSRTQWRVRIILPPDKAYFETQALWYNPNDTDQSYYNWMTAAAEATPDFQFYAPGDAYLKHNGQALPWPKDDQGRDLSKYKENSFGSSKSYHVVGRYNDFFGGYYNDQKYGFGHWAEYDDMPGQKLWIWALSRAGGIWENLLTDSDGQYVEFQAGRQFVQYAPGTDHNPISKAKFEPHAIDTWREIWFPIQDIGGLTDVSQKAVMYVQQQNDSLYIGINPFQHSQGSIKITSHEKSLVDQRFDLDALDTYTVQCKLPDWDSQYSIIITELNIEYHSDNNITTKLNRPFQSQYTTDSIVTASEYYRRAKESVNSRQYQVARFNFLKSKHLDSQNLKTLLGLADLDYRQGNYISGLRYVQEALSIDTYDPHANYMAGILYKAEGDLVNSKESFGWAARSMTYRSSAYAQIAHIQLLLNNNRSAVKYANRALDFNRFNINALMAKSVALRILGDKKNWHTTVKSIIDIDPLNHFAHWEQYLNNPSEELLIQFRDRNRSELTSQSYLELAIAYHSMGFNMDAHKILEIAPQSVLTDLWKAYLSNDVTAIENVCLQPVHFVFPYRRETVEVLHWAAINFNHWKLNFYQALNLWSLNRKQEALNLLHSCDNVPDADVFYISRAYLADQINGIDPLQDLLKAHSLNPDNYRTLRLITDYYKKQNDLNQMIHWAQMAYKQYPKKYDIGMDYTQALVMAQQYALAINILEKIQVLPFEGASLGRKLYEQAHIGQAIQLIQVQRWQEAIEVLNKSKEWPEHLGVGKPYLTEERQADFLLALIYEQTKQNNNATDHYAKVAQSSRNTLHKPSALHLLGLIAILKNEGSVAAEQLLNELSTIQPINPSIIEWVTNAFLHIKDVNHPKHQQKIVQHDKHPMMNNIYNLLLSFHSE